jgi:1-pyrroline-5-carboxylate dehydrogenase
MTNAYFEVPEPYNEPVLDYAPGDPETESLQARIAAMQTEEVEIPLIIGGQEIRTGDTIDVRSPHNHGHRLAVCHQAGEKEVKLAIEAALDARHDWANMPWEHRAAIFLKAADLLSGPWRDTVNGATMLGQSKTAYQAEIDAACEVIDFWRFNVSYMADLMGDQPISSPGVWNRVEYRALEGFIFAVTPFNFTAIGANLPTAPAMIGNVVLWKPSSTAVYANYYTYRVLQAAGLPDGVINFLPGPSAVMADQILNHPEFAGIHFTGSTRVFNSIWEQVGANMNNYKYYPRLVGETGGKDFIFAHPSAAPLLDELVVAALRGAFEYQGQKCSAASRMYVPRSIWPEFRQKFVAEVNQIKMGDTADFSNFMGAVIDKKAFNSIKTYIDYARDSDEAEIITGGGCDDSVGYFIEPTTIVTTNPQFKTMEEEIFGPVLTIYVYEDEALMETLTLCDETSPYALTGAIWARDRQAIVMMSDRLRNAAGNFYINDKPTGAVVGQQPFGGARGSGTNDKAGSPLNLLRWMSVRAIKETMVPPADWRYPFMGSGE